MKRNYKKAIRALRAQGEPLDYSAMNEYELEKCRAVCEHYIRVTAYPAMAAECQAKIKAIDARLAELKAEREGKEKK